MKWVCFERDGVSCAGLVRGDQVHPLPYTSVIEAWRRGGKDEPDHAQPSIPLAGLHLLAPIPRPGKIMALALNYADHVSEGGRTRPDHPKWFNKQTSAVHAPYGSVLMPRGSSQLDYEGELVAVIGRETRFVEPEQALQAVAGYCIGCDYSVRDWQKTSPTMTLGKSYDSHAPFGPALVTADEIPDPQALHIRTLVNGAERQSAPTSHMFYPVAEQIAYLSQHMTLHPGDVIFTGTPGGVGQWRDPPQWLKPGDTVRVEITGLGHIEHTVAVDDRAPYLD